MVHRELAGPARLRAWLRSEQAAEIVARCRRSAMYGIPATVTLVWLVAVLASGSFGRALDHWQSALTMVFGSFLAGSSPVGGGAVAFPVFTKLLDNKRMEWHEYRAHVSQFELEKYLPIL